MADQFTEVTNQSWGSRLGSAIGGVLFGGFLFLAAFPLLFWNEGRAVQTAKSLAEGAKAVVPIQADAVDSANDGKFVHLTGEAVTDESLTDPQFGVTVEDAVRLKRDVEMYQWVEHKEEEERKKLGGGTETVTTYTYEQEWSSTLHDSNGFRDSAGHGNPSAMPYTGDSWTVKKVTLGAFTLSNGLKNSISGSTPVSVDLATLPKSMQGKVAVTGNGYYLPANPVTEENTPPESTDPPAETEPGDAGDGEPTTDGGDDGDSESEDGESDGEADPDEAEASSTEPTVVDGLQEIVFLDDTEETAEPETGSEGEPTAGTEPEAGDAAGDNETPAETDPEDGSEGTTTEDEPESDTSSIPQPQVPGSPQVGDVRVTFTKTEQGTVSVMAQQAGDTFSAYQTEAGDALEMLEMGTVSAEEMIQRAANRNKILTWILRIVGMAMMFIGLTLVFKPLSVLADVVPFIGNVVGAGTGIIAFMIALACSFLTISIAWLFYRPMIGIPLLLVSLVAGFFVVKMLFGGSKSEPEAA